jgi:putative FmdB family regulatory protein
MPTYEYACAGCEHRFELEQSMKDEPVKTCPSCGADAASRQISTGAGFILKGGGWSSGSGSSGGSGAGKKVSAEEGAALSAMVTRETGGTDILK